MRRQSEFPRWVARFAHPLLALLIAAVAAVGAIAQCGLLLDEASSDTQAQPVERPQVAAAPNATASTETERQN